MQKRCLQRLTCAAVVAIFNWINDVERYARKDFVSMHKQAATAEGSQAKVHTGIEKEHVST